MNDPKITITQASTKEHIVQLFNLIECLAQFENLAPPDEDAKLRFERDGFQAEPPKFRAILAGIENQTPCGYAIFFDTYSSFLCRPTLYLEDIFVLPDSRKLGLGKAMMTYLISEASNNGFGRMEWTCLDWNTNAQRFYDRVGAQHMSEWFFYRMDQSAMRQYLQTLDGAPL